MDRKSLLDLLDEAQGSIDLPLDVPTKPSPSLLRAWASDPATMRATMGLKWGTYSVSTILIHAADALERAESLSPDAKVAQIVERAEEEPHAVRRPKTHPDCVAAMCGINPCHGPGPCYVTVDYLMERAEEEKP